MINGVLVLFGGPPAEYTSRLEPLGCKDVTVTDKKNDALNRIISDLNPRLVIIDSWFYLNATAYRIGRLLKLFPELNIAVVSLHDFPASRAPWFIWYGAKSYISLWEGEEEFKRGLRIVLEGKGYTSPKVQKIIDRFPEWPDTDNEMTGRQKECLDMLCCGFTAKQIGEVMQLSVRTVYNHLRGLYAVFNVHSRAEMTSFAASIGYVNSLDFRLSDRGKNNIKLPDWAVVKFKCDRYFSEFDNDD